MPNIGGGAHHGARVVSPFATSLPASGLHHLESDFSNAYSGFNRHTPLEINYLVNPY